MYDGTVLQNDGTNPFMTQKLCKYAPSLCSHLTFLAFSGELEDEEEISFSVDDLCLDKIDDSKVSEETHNLRHVNAITLNTFSHFSRDLITISFAC